MVWTSFLVDHECWVTEEWNVCSKDVHNIFKRSAKNLLFSFFHHGKTSSNDLRDVWIPYFQSKTKYILSMFWTSLKIGWEWTGFQISSKHSQNILKPYLDTQQQFEDELKMWWRCIENVLKMVLSCAEDVLTKEKSHSSSNNLHMIFECSTQDSTLASK